MRNESFPTPLPRWLAGSVIASGVSKLYETAIKVRNSRYEIPGNSKKMSRPVISIGGIRAGGTGKTPSAIFVGSYLLKKGYEVAFLSRGYHRTSKELQIIEPQKSVPWELIGDEPAMIHSILPESWLGICPDRLRAATELEKKMSKHSVFILDDGFQHRKISRDIDIVCLHESTFDEKMLPKGYLREPISSLSRANAAFLIGTEKKTLYLKQKVQDRFPELEIFELEYKPKCYIHAQTGRSACRPPNLSPVALCGIARPGRFFQTLRENGVQACKEMVFPDHYSYRADDIKKMQEVYSQGLLTTEKDAIRLLNKNIIPDGNFWYLKMDLCFNCDDSLKRFDKLLSIITL